jgi:hypothetical protein
LGELIPGLRNFTSPADLFITYVKHMVGDRIPDQYRGIRKIIDEEGIDPCDDRWCLLWCFSSAATW